MTSTVTLRANALLPLLPHPARSASPRTAPNLPISASSGEGGCKGRANTIRAAVRGAAVQHLALRRHGERQPVFHVVQIAQVEEVIHEDQIVRSPPDVD